MDERRIVYNSIKNKCNEATYIMSSSFRLNDNSSITYLINNYDLKHIIIHYVHEDNDRNVQFITPFLLDLKERLEELNLNVILSNTNEYTISNIKGDVILDKEYLKEKRQLESKVIKEFKNVIVFEDNLSVPIETTSNKEEYSARTIRPKIHNHLNDFIKPIDLLPPSKGEKQALDILRDFIDNKLQYYDQKNHPEHNYTSTLSAYLKYGLISPIRILYILETINSINKESFIEELIVRRELSYNFVYYNQGYNQFNKMTYQWAYETMDNHELDKREYIYTVDDYINCNTHDIYFNAAMKEMIYNGTMHGYMRMYWCKKIIEWSKSYQEAYDIAIYLNNYYFLDGNNPNGYTGIAWCFGKHDRAWTERPIFGKLRYMNSNGLKRKFDIDKYVERIKKEIGE